MMSSRSWWRNSALLALVPILAGLLLVAGCSDDETTAPPAEFDPPSALYAVNGSGSVLLRWTASSYASSEDFDGYNVYRHTASMAGLSDAAMAAYRIGQASGTSYNDTGRPNGTQYYYVVRALKEDGTLSERSNEINTAARTEGLNDVTIYEFAYSDQPSGLNCNEPAAYTMSSATPDNRSKIDLYLGTTGAGDESTQQLALKSPHLVLNGDAAWASRQAQLVLLGSGQSAWDRYDAPTTGWSTSVPLGTSNAEVIDKVIAVKTPPFTDGQVHYAKVWIQSVDSDPPGERTISVKVAWQSAPNYPRFGGR